MKLIQIPYSFILDNIFLSWREILWGYEHQFIGWHDVVGIAENYVLLNTNDSIVVELSLVKKTESYKVGELLRILANKEIDKQEYMPEKKWLFLILAWLFEKRDTISNPLSIVELIYAEFDYPVEIESFVQYMPPTDGYEPSHHSYDENIERLICNWKKYIDETRESMGIS